MIDILLLITCIGGFFVWLIGFMTVVSFCLPIKPPADKSNRINRIRLWWYAISAPHRSIHAFHWLRGDETDNLNDDTWSQYNG